jgi:hypothetical protein
MATVEVDLDELTDQMLQDPAIAETSEVIARRPVLDVYGHGIRFGGFQRDPRDRERIVGVHLIRIGAPELAYTLPTDSTRAREALCDALGQVARQLRAPTMTIA